MSARFAWALGASLSLLLAPQIAGAKGSSDDGGVPPLSSLPEGRLPLVPTMPPPPFVAAGEKVPGFVVTPPPAEQARVLRENRGDISLAYLFADAGRAKAFLAGTGPTADPEPATCFVDGASVMANAGPVSWPSEEASVLSMTFDVKKSAVRPVHAEHLVEGTDGHASLESTDVWLDTRTRGVRLIGRAQLPLARVFVGPNDLAVYAGRDGAKVVIVVRAQRSPVPGAVESFASELGSLAAVLPENRTGTSDCGHLRFELQAEAGRGEMATLQSAALLPPLEGNGAVAPDEAEASPAELATIRLQAMRRRSFQLSVSVSRTTSDPEPVLGVGVGWIARERRTGGT